MNDKDMSKLRVTRDFFRYLSNEHSDNSRTDDAVSTAYHEGRSQAYAFAADRIDKLIENEKDISKE